jgi:hypothetical protein
MTRLITVAGLTLLFVISAAAQDRVTFTVGTATAARGQKATGTIEVPAGSDAALSIPVAVFHGAKPGPVLAIVAPHGH